MFNKKTPMEKWRSQNRVAAAFADHSGWDVHLESGAVCSLPAHDLRLLLEDTRDPRPRVDLWRSALPEITGDRSAATDRASASIVFEFCSRRSLATT